ncbi:MAG: hypothetical protein WDN25_05690 [Acetobacteraceae bacterium]
MQPDWNARPASTTGPPAAGEPARHGGGRHTGGSDGPEFHPEPHPDSDRSLFDALPLLTIFWLIIGGLFLLPTVAVAWGTLLVMLAFIAGRRAAGQWRDPPCARHRPVLFRHPSD